LVEIELFVSLESEKRCVEPEKKRIEQGRLTMGMVLHSRLSILLISPVRMDWFAADTWGLRRLAKIMKAFMGRFGVPSWLRDWEVNAACSSSSGNMGELSE
jgi:hypothetical protein